ncbi:general secretion pathway protein GspB [Geobacter sp. DSM 9736]|uniref:general secretion pathway protein GspB n=1 Tax=Geobacter sp. DSM 9736 TaxID=1277350 RepID=UPI000B5122C2|nr:general secretion pathway protein GspB [Geobacter sp. DSM 9736]SNB46102.1 general secretion pathway protein B [Geobacter sp. DSM 9736]
MSSILKALKKLEQEKSTRKPHMPDLAGAVLKGERPAGPRRWLIPVAMSMVAVAAAAVTYFVMKHIPAPLTQPATIAVAVPSAAPSPEAAGVLHAVPAPPDKSLAVPPLPAKSEKVPPRAAKATTHLVTDSLKTGLKPAAPEPFATRPREGVTMQEPAQTISVAATPQKSDDSPSIRISGIAWQKDSSSRYAVVNGRAVGEGAIVEGAKVEEILPDKVRFSSGSGTFEVHLGPPGT